MATTPVPCAVVDHVSRETRLTRIHHRKQVTDPEQREPQTAAEIGAPMVIVARALGRSRRHCWKHGHTMQCGPSWISFPKFGRYRTRVLQEARHRTCAGGAVAVSRETTPATGAVGVCVGGPSDSAVGSGRRLQRGPSLKASQCVRWALERTLEVLPMAIRAAVADGLRDEMSVVV